MNSRKTVLIAEDEESNFTLLKYIFESEGMNVIWARDGDEAVKLHKEDNTIDLILMDIRMPMMNGLDACREIRKENQNIPIIAVTACALESDRNSCINAGCDEIVTKPIDRHNLLMLTKNYLTV